MGVSEDDAELAVGLFNGYCARCHTAGYSAGASFEQGAGTGAWGPSLVDGRSQVQFPEMQDQVSFVIQGSEDARQYGVNGLGTGRMPSFGGILSQTQIELIVKYERTL
jgi:mono/diheme cytochrome c family protein